MAYAHGELVDILDHLLAGWENEVVEFKAVDNRYPTEKIGKYFSALSNEANLRELDAAWLVFGVDNKTRSVVGTSFRMDAGHLESLKHQIRQGTQPSATFRNLYVLDHPSGRVIMMEVPPAPRGMYIQYNGFPYGRSGESLVSLDADKQDRIRNQSVDRDWTAFVVPEATVADLDRAAMQRARMGFAEQHAARIPADVVANWDDRTLLEKLHVTFDGKITRAGLLLLGGPSAVRLLSPNMAEMTWLLKGEEPAYEHFHPPFLLTATELMKRIRNIQIRLMPPNELIYREISKYDERSLLEAIYNCIAHQDYTKHSRILVTEYPDRVEFLSTGEFFDGTPDQYMLDEYTPRTYRNPALVNAMTELNLIDHMGFGIHRIARDQVRRFLPLPDYDLSTFGEVRLTIPGAVIDLAYSQALMVHTNLSFKDVLALDHVQKHAPVSRDEVQHLRRMGLVEGRRPNLHVSAQVAEASDMREDYIRSRLLEDDYLAKLITDLLGEFGSADRKSINRLLFPKLPDALSEHQKRTKVSNLLTSMRKRGLIHNAGSRRYPTWELP